LNAEKPKVKQPRADQRRDELSEALKLGKNRTRTVSWTENVSDAMSMKKIKI
jgi:hypothetical protein